ncbi:MAG: hypothetical protein L0Y58_08995 [Verrucomicrobia subdivision 3 bacterium]|nr:hypothetical protein [Limisphaerales bacterium]
MDPTTPASQTGSSDITSEFRSLKNLFYAATFGLIVMSVGVNIYLGKQMRLAQAQLFEQRQGRERSADDFAKTTEPLIRNFTAALQSFAATNKDFEPILSKYRPALAKYMSGLAPAAQQPAAKTNQ